MSKLFCECCEPTAFLNPELFKTEWDIPNSDKSDGQYGKGRRIGESATAIHISYTGSWSATLKTGSSLDSYEKIGYHANTADLLQGFLDSGCEIHVYRWDRPACRIK